MSSSTGRSRVSELTFRVFDRPIHPDWFAVRAHRRVAVDGWQADIRIVDGGHAVAWGAGPTRLAEVLVGRTDLVPEAGVLLDARVRAERTARLRPGRGVEYQTCVAVERLDPEVFAHLCEEMTLDARRDRLFHRYPGSHRLAPPAISHLTFESRARGLLVHAFHSFPAERAIVRTQSLFETPTDRPGPR